MDDLTREPRPGGLQPDAWVWLFRGAAVSSGFAFILMILNIVGLAFTHSGCIFTGCTVTRCTFMRMWMWGVPSGGWRGCGSVDSGYGPEAGSVHICTPFTQ